MDTLSVKEIVSILEKFRENKLSDEEHVVLGEWLDSSEDNRSLFNHIFYSKKFDESLEELLLTKISIEEKIKARIALVENNPEEVVVTRRIIPLRKWALAAASVLIVMVTGAVIWKVNRSNSMAPATNLAACGVPDIQPGGNKAVLHLSSGQTILLDSAAIGKIATEGSSTVTKSEKASLSYVPVQDPGGSSEIPVVCNSLQTPRGGFYVLALSDGTRVWLNSSSSLSYPTRFQGKERVVTLTGEGYFEVAKDKLHPFKVLIGSNAGKKGSVEVLGTHFNIKAYDDEPSVETTLLEGSVNYRFESKGIVLAPGEQAQLTGQDLHLNKDIDAKSFIAWKDGFFQFRETGVSEVLKQMSRWYSVDVVYGQDVSNVKLSGRLRKSVNFADVVQMLEISGVKCDIKGNKLTVSK